MPRQTKPLPDADEETVKAIDKAYAECQRKLPMVYRNLRRLAQGKPPIVGKLSQKVFYGDAPKPADALKAIQLYIELFDPRLARQRLENTSKDGEAAVGAPALPGGSIAAMWRALKELGIDPKQVIQAKAVSEKNVDLAPASAPLPECVPTSRNGS